ncbi:MAG: hypothetical protein M0Q21_12585 [Ignavibacteriaceae bacterium]|nr:hypothetical protein [Ignavibacteriaceae bacterium]
MKNIVFIFTIVLSTNFSFPQRSQLSNEVQNISEFIASDSFFLLKEQEGEFQSIDSLYLIALSFTGNNIQEALLALTFAVVPYKNVPIRFLFKFNYPLLSADDSTFKKKNKNLPKYFLADSPKNEFGDRDKLAHFFGNAFVAYTSQIFDLTKAIGYFVEVFEENFTPENQIDLRDLKINKLGEAFGKSLKKDQTLLPSFFIKKYQQ